MTEKTEGTGCQYIINSKFTLQNLNSNPIFNY